MRWLFGALLALPFAASAEDARLNEVREMLAPMRKVPAAHLRVRGATPELTVIKHTLRDWIESRLTALAADGDPTALGGQLDELKQAGLFCADGPQRGETPCPERSLLGFLDAVRLYRPPLSEFAVVQTAVGINCGFDASADAYERSGDHWRRFWQREQDDYAVVVP